VLVAGANDISSVRPGSMRLYMRGSPSTNMVCSSCLLPLPIATMFLYLPSVLILGDILIRSKCPAACELTLSARASPLFLSNRFFPPASMFHSIERLSSRYTSLMRALSSVFSGTFAHLAFSLARFSIRGGEEEEQKEQVQVRGYTYKQARTR
jgi:hypothetical protein